MASLSGFDATVVEPSVGFEVMPAGDYTSVITESGYQQNKAGTGEFLKVTFQIIDGQHKGRNIWTQLNLKHPSSQTIQFAQAELSAICRAVGVLKPNDSQELHNLPLTLVVGVEKRKDTGELTNRIKGYRPKNGNGNHPSPAAAQTSTTPPWARKAV